MIDYSRADSILVNTSIHEISTAKLARMLFLPRSGDRIVLILAARDMRDGLGCDALAHPSARA